ncbi:LCP family protein [Lachnoclostridium edouardi]|uniref:LCP family protein n=1 Tax=Lachnoclostridium edouardi TaxID=1926283 RepID=UPI000C7B105B|nr:LCP family protein [Lachnoclostridium edouardi]
MKRNEKLKKAGLLFLSFCMFLVCSGLLYVTRMAGMIHMYTGPETEAAMINTNLNEETSKKLKDYWTVALFGTDSRREDMTDDPANSDTIILCTIERESGEVRLVSVARDLYVMGGSGEAAFHKVTQSYFKGGPVQMVSDLNQNMDLQIDDFIACNWKAVAQTINILGGIDLEITDEEFYYLNSFITETVKTTGIGSNHLKKGGWNHLDGVQAVAYCRLRLMDNDLKRTERQRKVISLTLDKMKEAGWPAINQILETVLPQIETTISPQQLADMGKKADHFNIVESQVFPFQYQEALLGKKGNVLVPNTLEKNVEKLHSILYEDTSYQCTDKVRRISRGILRSAVHN